MTNIQSSNSTMEKVKAASVFNIGSAPFNIADTPVYGAVIPSTIFDEHLNWDSRRPQIALRSDAPEFDHMVAELHNDVTVAVGMVRAQYSEGGCLAAVVYENEDFGLYVCFDPQSPTGRALLQDWREHENMHITFECNGVRFSNRQPLSNSLIGKLLATKSRSEHQLGQPMKQRLQTMQIMALALGTDKPRLFVMTVDIPLELVERFAALVSPVH